MSARCLVERSLRHLCLRVHGGGAIACSGKFVQRLFGIFDLAQRRCLYRCLVGEVDYILADLDQIAADRKIIDDAAIILGIDDRCRLGGKPRQILIDGEAGDVLIRRQERLERYRRRDFSGAN